jgi:adenosylmethionine-8-amino-7-oxononanoate aminotransferase
MIKGIAGSQGVIVNGGNTSLPYVNQNSSNPMQGVVRVWGTDLQVFDGSNWAGIASSYATIELDFETRNLLDYVREQRKEELEFKALISDHHHPAVRLAQKNLEEAMQAVKTAKEQLKITAHLSRDYEETAT